MNTGSCDTPIRSTEKDRLSMSGQVCGLAEFIKTCETPMTVSIQGTWGTGKTSFVNLVTNHILNCDDPTVKEDFIFVPFNSWKFVQFDMSDQLSSSIILAITKELSRDLSDENTLRSATRIINGMELLKRTGKLSALLANEVIKEKLDVDVKETLDRAGLTEMDKLLKKSTTAIDTINDLRGNLQKMINTRLGLDKDKDELPEWRKKRKRVIFFVDDLDRLSPEKAVEVLEVLNMFLDCEHCVFLLAIDYSVVVNGVALKYKNTIAAHKGRDFFEKMIQVVYTLPEKMNHVDRYIAELLSRSGRNISLSYEFADLAKSCGKDNPRAIKRLMNSYILLDMMRSAHHPSTQRHSIMLFALLCLQTSCPELYNHFSGQFGHLYNYEKGVNWFNTLHRFCCEYSQHGRSSVTVSEDQLQAWDLLKPAGRKDHYVPDRDKLSFLALFLDTFVPSNNSYRNKIGALLTLQSILDLKNCIRWTDMLQDQSFCHSELDNVSLIKTEHGGFLKRTLETRTGTIEEAYRLTVADMLRYVLERDGIFNDSIFSSPFEETPPVPLSGDEVLGECAALFCYFISLTPQPEGEWEEQSVCGRTYWLRIGFSGIDPALRADKIIAFLQLLSNYLRTGFIWFRDRHCREILSSGYVRYEEYNINEVCFITTAQQTRIIQNRDPYLAYYDSITDILSALSHETRCQVIENFSHALSFDPPKAPSDSKPEDTLWDVLNSSGSDTVFSFDGDFADPTEENEDAFPVFETDNQEGFSDFLSADRDSAKADDTDVDSNNLDYYTPLEYETEAQRAMRNNSSIISGEEYFFETFSYLTKTDRWMPLSIISEDDGGQIDLYVHMDTRPAVLAKTLYEIAHFLDTEIIWYTTPYLKEQIRFGRAQLSPALIALKENELKELGNQRGDLFSPRKIAFSDRSSPLDPVIPTLRQL